GAPRFVFTQLIAPGEIEARLPVARLGRLERADAIELGRALGAQRVVWGQIANLRSDTDTDRWTESIWRPTEVRDSSGQSRQRWVEVPFRAISRFRTVHVEAEYEIIDLASGTALDRAREGRDAAAHTAYTRDNLDGDPDGYRLLPPDATAAD